ncbi:S-adenosyl-L-methionine-dependent methyltransferase [Zychaea mexicana]|uniref:S-adenosyl-L-methionine-dependent methyltransferase n=1 Tax=Zychaea mexicana TaxID=64656 RepID=UPI0022FDCA06|nr:S-adenosyl-L-methionine-dependent methyltransferase [Zychaea mexicana]KAI9494831.1 S-adenosyl-L-methionine-dependent methyltransferase [Zychaea mexicana]
MPNDEQEQDRLTNLVHKHSCCAILEYVAHFVLKHCFSGNYSAPVQDLLQQPSSSSPRWYNNVSTASFSLGGSSNTLSTGSTQSSGRSRGRNIQPRVLDVACGTGIWILEMATEFPHAQFHGIDLSTMYPADIKPPNTHFCQGDVLNGLPYTDAYFDYIHMSLVYNCFSYEDRKQLLLEIRRVLKPGGYVEFRDLDPYLRNTGPKTREALKPFHQAMMDNLDVDITWTTHMCENLQHTAGMTDIHHQVVSINFISSSKLSETFNATVFAEWESYRYFCVKYYNLTNEEYNAMIQSVMEECKKQRSFLNYVMCWGRKPIIDVPSSANIQRDYVRAGSCTPPPAATAAAAGSSSSSSPTSHSQHHHRHSHTPPFRAPSFIKSVSSPVPATTVSTPMSRSSPKSRTQSSGMIPSSKNSPGSLKAREDARRNKEKTSDIYQFAHGYVE